ncbi:hypothetical protein Hamer_G025425 [Homarus americanus]|uniref:Uncharacterized protein n=1 Tax=Homarus americanus TaxID=6706 RepID=A0A8J5MLD8_HOMAM|nr:hypothetical protein Hamer_G025425 [Homarus americanus]
MGKERSQKTASGKSKLTIGGEAFHRQSRLVMVPSPFLTTNTQAAYKPMFCPQQIGQLGQRGYQFVFPSVRQVRQTNEPLYDLTVMENIVNKAKAKMSNFTCSMKKMGYLDNEFNLRFDYIKKHIENFNLNTQLTKDLHGNIDKCKQILEVTRGQHNTTLPQVTANLDFHPV